MGQNRASNAKLACSLSIAIAEQSEANSEKRGLIARIPRSSAAGIVHF